MVKKILLNDINFITPHGRMAWIRKLNYFKKMGYAISVISSNEGITWYSDKINLSDSIIVPYSKNRVNTFCLIVESLKRNFIAIFFTKKVKDVGVIYSLATLDSVIYPFFLKKITGNIKWVVQFDNTVPLISEGKIIAGNKLVRILAWVFFHLSLILLKSADYVFVIKPELKEYLKVKGFSGEKLVLTGNGVETDLIKNAKIDARFNIDALFMGRINEAKGIYDMLNVLKKVKEKYDNFQLAIMGDGVEATKNKFKKKIKSMVLESNIQFLGYKTGQEKFNIMKSSKIFLFLSETESVPIAPLEAVCMGLKTLVYDLDAYNMYKNNEVIIFKKNDCASVAQKIIEIFEKKDFRNDSGKLLLERYSWDAISEIEFKHL